MLHSLPHPDYYYHRHEIKGEEKDIIHPLLILFSHALPSKDFLPYSVKVGLSPAEKICFICFNKNPLKMMKNAFYFMLKALFILKIFKFLF